MLYSSSVYYNSELLSKRILPSSGLSARRLAPLKAEGGRNDGEHGTISSKSLKGGLARQEFNTLVDEGNSEVRPRESSKESSSTGSDFFILSSILKLKLIFKKALATGFQFLY